MEPNRMTKKASLKILKELGFSPVVVFDIGAQDGTFDLYQTFPESAHVLIEPVKENEGKLQEIVNHLTSATYLIAAASSKTGTGTLKITRNCLYSGLVGGSDSKDSNSHFHREVPTIAIDDLVNQANLSGPFLLKIDVDGTELDVLQGAKKSLEQVEVAVIESTLFFQIHDVIDFMHRSSFVIYDIIEPLYRPLDGALWQVDLVFVKKDSIFRKSDEYDRPDKMVMLRGG